MLNRRGSLNIAILILAFVTFMGHSQSQTDTSKKLSDLIHEIDRDVIENKGRNLIDNYYRGLDLVQHSTHDSLKLEFYTYVNQTFLNYDLFDETIHSGNQAIASGEKLNPGHVNPGIWMTVANAYEQKGDIESALELVSNVQASSEAGTPSLRVLTDFNNLGFFYFDVLKDNQKAMYCFNKVNEYPKGSLGKEEYLRYSIFDNIALVHMARGHYELAKPLFVNNYAFYQTTTDYERWMRAGLQWVDVDIKLGTVEEARNLLTIIEKQMDSLGSYPLKERNTILLNQTKEHFYELVGDYQNAEYFAENSWRLIDSVNNSQEAKNLQYYVTLKDIALKRSQDNLQKEEELINSERKKRKLNMGLWLLSLIIFLLAIVLAILHYRGKISRKKRELKDNKRDINLFSQTMLSNQQWVKELLSHVVPIKDPKDSDWVTYVDSFEQVIRTRLLSEDDLEEFGRKVDELSNDFYSTLHDRYPNLTKTEIKICSLIRLGLDNQQIALLQNVSLPSIHTSRFRLKKKLELSAGDNLDALILSL